MKTCTACNAGRVVAVLLIVGALAFTILAGLVAAAVFVFMLFAQHGGGGTTPSHDAAAVPPMLLSDILSSGAFTGVTGVLLLAIAILLLLVLLLLIVLLWCTCRGVGKGMPLDVITALLPLIPHVRDIGPAVRAAVTALRASSAALAIVQQVGDRLSEVVDVAGGTVDVLEKGDSFPFLEGFFTVKKDTIAKDVSGFGDVVSALATVKAAGSLLSGPDGGLSSIRSAKEAVDTAATALDPIATALGAPPPQ